MPHPNDKPFRTEWHKPSPGQNALTCQKQVWSKTAQEMALLSVSCLPRGNIVIIPNCESWQPKSRKGTLPMKMAYDQDRVFAKNRHIHKASAIQRMLAGPTNLSCPGLCNFGERRSTEAVGNGGPGAKAMPIAHSHSHGARRRSSRRATP